MLLIMRPQMEFVHIASEFVSTTQRSESIAFLPHKRDRGSLVIIMITLLKPCSIHGEVMFLLVNKLNLYWIAAYRSDRALQGIDTTQQSRERGGCKPGEQHIDAHCPATRVVESRL